MRKSFKRVQLPIDVTSLKLLSDTFSKLNVLFYPDFATRESRNFCLENKGLRAQKVITTYEELL